MSSSDFDALNDALISGSHETINFLLFKKIKLSKESLLHKCLHRRNHSILELLLHRGANVNHTDKNVLEATDTSKMDKLLEYGANINSLCENFGYTPLAHAVLKEDEKTVSHLLKKGASFLKYSINAVLHQLILHASPKMEKFLALLIDSGADINSKNEMGKTPLQIAIADFRSKNYLRILMDFGSDVNLQDGEGNSPLHWAIRMGNDVALQTLLEYDADVSILKKSNEYPLVSGIRKINMFSLTTRFMSHDVSSELTVRFFSAEMNVFFLIQIIIVKEVTGKFLDDKLLTFVKKNLDYFYRVFLKELEGMRVKAVKAKVSYFDLLTKSAKEVEPYMSQKMIENLQTSEIDKNFPFYAQMMKMRISKIKERLILVEHSGGFLKTVFRLKFSPPNIICEMICSYLSSFDLINFWRVCKHPEEYLSTLLDRPVQ
ncbi:putative ankyrin repeat protein RF_0381 isoform X2 [Belonocnema kinseyi]|uniref:putative ankyrin repeat protein RF_0381 isoform X2 n=1 Tax=Belonocnema kinseyi TaxID=2817044 RepID=UPI00143CF981|nr:putative ankyrin repeat protein RF_0381 isoform X2 [Belonocnema kinseyi]